MLLLMLLLLMLLLLFTAYDSEDNQSNSCNQSYPDPTRLPLVMGVRDSLAIYSCNSASDLTHILILKILFKYSQKKLSFM